MDKDGYPTDDELETIRNWSHEGGFNQLMEYIREQWIWPHFIGCVEEESKKIWHISTGGWSGHEDIMRALQDNFVFWTTCWLWSKRGGHYKFEISS